MSTGLECDVVEATPGQWFYLLQSWDCPVGAWDWREFCDAYGPFATDDDAYEHLREHHANPGGSMHYPFVEGEPVGESTLAAIAKAPQNMKRFERPRYGRYW